jgi:serine/threonine protein kinase
VRRRKSLSEYISAFIIGKVIEATIYLHGLEIIHRDLKPENIMVMLKRGSCVSKSAYGSVDLVNDDEGIENIKLIDFGLANHQSELDKNEEKHGIAGTPNYIAPEIILGRKPSPKSDIFSIGSILYFL